MIHRDSEAIDFRPARGQGQRRQVHTSLVHGHTGRAQGRLGHGRGARERPDAGDGVRRVGDRGFRALGRERHVCPSRPNDVHDPPVAAAHERCRQDVLRHRHPRRQAIPGGPPVRAPQEPGEGRAARPDLLRRPRDRVLLLQELGWHRATGRRRVLRPGPAGHGDRSQARDGPDPGGAGHTGRVQPSRGRAGPAGDRPAPHGRADHGGYDDDVPPGGQGDSHEARLLRDVHAEADLRHKRQRDAHAPVPFRGWAQRVL